VSLGKRLIKPRVIAELDQRLMQLPTAYHEAADRLTQILRHVTYNAGVLRTPFKDEEVRVLKGE